MLCAQWLSSHQTIVGINISASSRWPSKNWPLVNIARLCEELSQRQVRVVLTGTEKDLASASRLSSMLKNSKPINACGKTTVNQLASLIKRCSVYISPDSASLHVASGMQVPFIALFGPTDHRRHLVPGKKYMVLRKETGCNPCYKSKCKRARCMELIKPEVVLEAIDKLLK
jgi:ADP-heptose:LPS heptosyltransferase